MAFKRFFPHNVFLKPVCLLAIGFSLLSVPAFAQHKEAVFTIQIHAAKEAQTIHSFGASDAWSCQMIGRYWPEQEKEKIARWLFSKKMDKNGNPEGIGLSMWRFYLGAGSTEQGDSSKIRSEWRRAESFLEPDGRYNWDKYTGQKWFLKKAKEYKIENLLAFSISPLVQYTRNGKAFSESKEQLNIQSGKMAPFADYLAETLRHFQQEEKISFNYISPFNEPQWDWAPGKNGYASQEGSGALNTEQAELVRALSTQMIKKNVSAKIILGEAAQQNYTYETGNKPGRANIIDAFFNPKSASYIGALSNLEKAVSTHSYFSNNPVSKLISNRLSADSAARKNNIGLWQTEYCILGGSNPYDDFDHENNYVKGGGGVDTGINSALYVARIIHHDLVFANVKSWQWWLALSPSDYKDGLILTKGEKFGENEANKHSGTATATKRLWALGNFSRFIRPGMIRIATENNQYKKPEEAITGVMVSAYKNTRQKQLVVVLVNYAEKDFTYKIDAKGIKLKRTKLLAYTTDSNHSLQKSTVSAGKISIPKRAVVTLVANYK